MLCLTDYHMRHVFERRGRGRGREHGEEREGARERERQSKRKRGRQRKRLLHDSLYAKASKSPLGSFLGK